MKCSMKTLASPPALSPLPLSMARMKRTAEGLMILLEESLPAGCLEWAAIHRPDVVRYLDEAAAGLTAAVSKADHAEFVQAVAFCSEKYRDLRTDWLKEG